MTAKMCGVALLFFSLLVLSDAITTRKIGVNYGRLGNNLPSAYQSIEILRSMRAGSVKLYDANPEILRLLARTNIHVSIMVTQNEIISIAANQTTANKWVEDNVLRYYPDTMIRTILVGNEVLSSSSDAAKQIWNHLVPAMRRIKISLRAQDIRNIKIGTPLAMDALQTTFPPSNGTFRPDISTSVMVPLLNFLNSSKSYFFIDVYPYFPWSADPINISLNFALLQSNIKYTDPGTGLVYTNLLDQMLDSVVFAMTKLGYPDVRLSIAETGWPNAGDFEEAGANIKNAATYNRNLVRKMAGSNPTGTPARPGALIPTFIFALYDENRKTGPGTERHWGLLHPNGTSMYQIDLTGKRASSDYEPLPPAHNNAPYKGKLWCIASPGVNLTELERALTFACNQGNGTCDSLTPGKECYEPLSVAWHASYAFSSYWAKFRSQGANCYFNGLAQQTNRNPSELHDFK
uniref:glucan endo-1,3-beta-D-glucosidase n=1 Tax=Salix viminalis TaxID=40686 RepID=A0A6N2MB80_SALVM